MAEGVLSGATGVVAGSEAFGETDPRGDAAASVGEGAGALQSTSCDSSASPASSSAATAAGEAAEEAADGDSGVVLVAFSKRTAAQPLHCSSTAARAATARRGMARARATLWGVLQFEQLNSFDD